MCRATYIAGSITLPISGTDNSTNVRTDTASSVKYIEVCALGTATRCYYFFHAVIWLGHALELLELRFCK